MDLKTVITAVLLTLLAGMVSCKKDHDIPTGKVFNGGSGGGSAVDSLTISVSAHPSEGGTVTGGGKYQKGKTCVVTASANEGYVFTNWTENGTQVSTNANYTFTVAENRNLVANFQAQQQQYTINVSANPNNGGTVTGGGIFNQGASCTVTATPANSNYTFTNWTENGNVVSSQANFTFTVTSNRTLVANFNANPSWPNGLLPGYFSVSATQQVQFSQGNLQYIGSAGTPYWKFADNQWDVLGTTTGQNSTSQNVDRDLFGWGTSGWNSGNTYYRPWDSDNSNGSLYGPPGEYNLTGSYANSDWGYYNAISNGGGQAGLWRTLTQGEWDYVFNNPQRGASLGSEAHARYAKAQVAGVWGVIVFPDSYTHPGGVAQPVGINETGNTGWNGNDYSSTDFGLMQANGAVFLPATGYRNGTSVHFVGNIGYYWSASYEERYHALGVVFSGTYLYTDNFISRYFGRSVRLVARSSAFAMRKL